MGLFDTSSDIISEVFKVLRQFKERPLSIHEISILTRARQKYVGDVIDTLLKANVVFKEGDKFILNRNKNKYNLLNAFK